MNPSDSILHQTYTETMRVLEAERLSLKSRLFRVETALLALYRVNDPEMTRLPPTIEAIEGLKKEDVLRIAVPETRQIMFLRLLAEKTRSITELVEVSGLPHETVCEIMLHPWFTRPRPGEYTLSNIGRAAYEQVD